MSHSIELMALAQTERNHYMKGFAAAFKEWCRKKQNSCVAELLIRPNGMSVPDPYDLIRVDMVSNLNKTFDASQYELDKPLRSFPPKSFDFSSTLRLHISPFMWNRVDFRSPVAPSNIQPLTNWTNKWMDVKDSKPIHKDKFMESVHSVVYPSVIRRFWQFEVDFGSAQPEALNDLLQTLDRMGLREVRVGSFGETR